ncbi:hypothetical protein E4695_15780 [Alcaligenaceae bacterium 429]|uniref:copper-binding protein n=1 Tax=Paenalcaligenes sp. Me52 TaxID=3392038 RepID=UPI0010921DE5|nr:hypothetical protein E4695_15780 [Alcaligenaceae bacterium 429]
MLRTLRKLSALLAIVFMTLFSSVSVAQEARASGEVRRVDPGAGKITLKHGEIDVLRLPAMTLVYRIDPTLLADLKPGDKVRFVAIRENDEYVVISIQK